MAKKQITSTGNKTATKPRYYSLEEALNLIEGPNKSKCVEILEENRDMFRIARGSQNTKHQPWVGGYLDHVTDTMNLAILFYGSLSATGRPLNFTLSDSLLVMFLHDLEKPFKQVKGRELGLYDSSGKKDNSAIKMFREDLFKKYKLELTEQQVNAIRYVEGENEDYHPTERVMNELSAFCHLCDIWSARGWYNFPAESNDPWNGARRSLARRT